ncbi:uncharacterized protein [Fopius arisanus]|nr:PREDICTED: uncharacterized protein LOC105265141 isoform X2 [Fopius arisanus]
MIVETEDYESMMAARGGQMNEDDNLNHLNAVHVIIDEMLLKNTSSSTAYHSLGEIAQSNPLAITRTLHGIFKKILLEEKLSPSDRNSYEKLMSDIIHACIRLKVLNKMIASILMVLNESLMNTNIISKIMQSNRNILPQDFIDKFSLSISNSTNSQAARILATFAHHLASCVMHLEDRKEKQTFANTSSGFVTYFEVITQLTTAFLEGVNVIEITWPLLGKQKLIKGLLNLGKTFFVFGKAFTSKIEHNKYQIIRAKLWKMMKSWQTVIGFINHYYPDVLTGDDWSNILHYITNFENDIDNFIGSYNIQLGLAFLKPEENRIQYIWNLPSNLRTNEANDDELYALEQSWSTLANKYPHTTHNLSSSNVSHLAELLVENLQLTTGILTIDSFQNNMNLVTAFIFEIFRKIRSIFGESTCTTKDLLDEINKMNWWTNEEHQDALKTLKSILTTSTWVVLSDHNILNCMIKYLRVLVSLPLMHCTTNLKMIIFLVILSMKKETLNNKLIDSLCTDILLNSSERCNEDFLQYIQLESHILELSKSQHLFARVIERSLTNPSNYMPLKRLFSSHHDNREILTIVIQSMEEMKLKLKTEHNRRLLMKFEKKLLKKLLSHIDDESSNIHQLKTLKVALEAAIALNEVDNHLINTIRSTLPILITKLTEGIDGKDTEFAMESSNLLKVILQYRNSGVLIDIMTLKNIWRLILNGSCMNSVPVVIEASDVRILNYSLHLLTRNTLKSLKNSDEHSFENCLIIWTAITKATMQTSHDKVRQRALQKLIQLITAIEGCFDQNLQLNIIKLFIAIMSSRKMIVINKTIDIILTLATRFMHEQSEALSLTQKIMDLCSSFLNFRPELAVDYLSIILRLYLKAVQTTVEAARRSPEQRQLQCLIILKIQKLTTIFVKFKKIVGRHSPYIIADMIKVYYGGEVIPKYVKEPLDDSVSQLMSMCDQHAISLLFRVIPMSMQETFKNSYNTHIKFYKFTGKI